MRRAKTTDPSQSEKIIETQDLRTLTDYAHITTKYQSNTLWVALITQLVLARLDYIIEKQSHQEKIL